MDGERTARLFHDLFDRRVEQELDALDHRDLQQPVADLRVITAQDAVPAVDESDLDAELVEHTRELIRDVTAACDEHASRQLFEMESLVRSDAELAAGRIWHMRTRTGGDENYV